MVMCHICVVHALCITCGTTRYQLCVFLFRQDLNLTYITPIKLEGQMKQTQVSSATDSEAKDLSLHLAEVDVRRFFITPRICVHRQQTEAELLASALPSGESNLYVLIV